LEYWLWLRLVEGIGSVTERKLLEYFGNPKNIYEADQEQLRQVEGIGPKLATNIHSTRSLDQALRLQENIYKQEINILTIHDANYPQQLLQYPKAPTILYYKGKIKDSKSGVAVVGARRCSSYGKQVTLDAANYLAGHSIPVISGLAKGVDSYAHIACIKANGYTIAVVAHGLDQCYPKEHRELMQVVIETGLIMSEYPPDTMPRPEYFPERNALIAGLCSKVLIVEAGQKSGALITAKLAKERGKELFVPPHEIYSPSGIGCNQLILKGATVYLHPKQLINTAYLTLEIAAKPSDTTLPQLTGNEKKIGDCLTNSKKTIEDIERETGINQLELLELLSIMELEGHIQALPGGRFRSNGT
jgi:DNA processing protein